MLDALLSWLCHHLPARVASTLFYRFVNQGRLNPARYADVRLRDEPTLRLKLLPGDTSHGCMAYCGFYEAQLSRVMRELAAREGGLLIDAGANYGYFSLLWALARERNQVVSYEPSSRNYAGLVYNVERNAQSHAITTQQRALGDGEGTVFVQIADSGQSGWDKVAVEAGLSTEAVPLTSLDVAHPEGTITALKLDCEGYEMKVLDGARQMLSSQRVRHVFFESNAVCLSANGTDSDEACAFLSSLGYKVERITETEMHAFLLA